MSGEKNQAATPERVRRAREQGDLPRSRALAALGGLGAGALALWSSDLGPWAALAETTLRLEGGPMAEAWLRLGLGFVGPIAAAAGLGGLVGSLALGGLVWSPAALRLRFERLDPAKGAKRLVEPKVWADGVRDLGWMATVGVTTAVVARQMELLGQPRLALGAMVGGVLVVGLPWAGLDALWTASTHRRRLRMSLQDVKEEAKRRDGDPTAKQQRRQQGRQLMQESLQKRVASASVLLVNPTHLAVALAHDPEKPDPPWVVARGRGREAARLRALARRTQVPVVRHVALARRLHRLEVEEFIPEALYGPVAAVLCRLLTEQEAE